MKKLFPIILTVTVFVGCSKSNPSNVLLGTWRLDSVHQTEIDSLVTPPITSFWDSTTYSSANTLEFNSNNSFTVTNPISSYGGNYTIANEEVIEYAYVFNDTAILHQSYIISGNNLALSFSYYLNQQYSTRKFYTQVSYYTRQ
jgi:hypothetical protein